jgi:hypothetical protein
MIQIEDYVHLGFRGIVFLDVRDWEEKSGYQDEHTIQTLACYDKDGRPLKLDIHWIEKWRPNGGGKGHILEKKELIDQEEYEELVKTHGVQDDPLYHQERARKENKRRIAEKGMEKLTPKCPLCSTPMALRHRKKDGAPFWGCVGFHRGACRGTRPIAPKVYQKYGQLSKDANTL